MQKNWTEAEKMDLNDVYWFKILQLYIIQNAKMDFTQDDMAFFRKRAVFFKICNNYEDLFFQN